MKKVDFSSRATTTTTTRNSKKFFHTTTTSIALSGEPRGGGGRPFFRNMNKALLDLPNDEDDDESHPIHVDTDHIPVVTDDSNASLSALEALRQFAIRLEQIQFLTADSFHTEAAANSKSKKSTTSPPSVQKATLRDFGYRLFEQYHQLPSIHLKAVKHDFVVEYHDADSDDDDEDTEIYYNADRRKRRRRKKSRASICQRQDIIRFLALECAADLPTVRTAVSNYYHHHHIDQEDEQAEKKNYNDDDGTFDVRWQHSVARLRHACVPAYEQIIRSLIEQDSVQAMQFLVKMREDLRVWLPWLQQSIHLRYQEQHLNQKNKDPEMKKWKEDQHDFIASLRQLDAYLQQLFQTWFSNGMLETRRITYEDTPASIIETIAKQEAVHPMRNLDDLRNRLSRKNDRRVFALFHPLLPNQPLVVLYVSLQPTTPTSMKQVHEHSITTTTTPPLPMTPTAQQISATAVTSSQVAASPFLTDDQNYQKLATPRVATFYSISNLQPGLVGVGLGEYIIKQAVKSIQADVSTIDTFLTLSPIPRFCKWLQERLALHQQAKTAALNAAAAQGGNNNNKDQCFFGNQPLLNPDSPRHQKLLQRLAKRLNCSSDNGEDEVLGVLVERLENLKIRHGGIVVDNLEEFFGNTLSTTNSASTTTTTTTTAATPQPVPIPLVSSSSSSLQQQEEEEEEEPPSPFFILDDPCVKEVMTILAAKYLVHEKHRRKPLDAVARFHVGNGALLDQIHWGADLSTKGWRNSFGIMVNYKYSPLQDVPIRQAQYERKQSFMPVSPDIEQLLLAENQ